MQTVKNILGTFRNRLNLDMASMNLKMGVIILGIGKTIWLMVTERKSIKTAAILLAIGKKIRRMDKVYCLNKTNV